MKSKVWLLCILAVLTGLKMNIAEASETFKPGQIWKDTNGNLINAHGGGFLFHNGKYYWYGEHKITGEEGNTAMVGVHCYSSPDLYNWTDEGIALPVAKDDVNSPITAGCIIERPKVIFNSRTGKFVMWFHLELKGQGYSAAQTGVAVSNRATGPFTFVKASRADIQSWPVEMSEEQKKSTIQEKELKEWSAEWVNAIKEGMFVRRDFDKGQMSRDMSLFVDDDGKAYHIHASEENLTMDISELSDDYTSFTGKYTRVFPAGHNEAPAVFKHKGKYYMITSGCTGWAPNAARCAVSESIWGPWKELGNPCVGDFSDLTFHSQSTYVIPVQGKQDAKFGESIYETQGGPFQPVDSIYGSTFKGKNVYLHLMKTNAGTILIPSIDNKLLAFKCLTGETLRVKQNEKGISVKIGANTNKTDIIVRLEFEKEIDPSQLGDKM